MITLKYAVPLFHPCASHLLTLSHEWSPRLQIFGCLQFDFFNGKKKMSRSEEGAEAAVWSTARPAVIANRHFSPVFLWGWVRGGRGGPKTAPGGIIRPRGDGIGR